LSGSFIPILAEALKPSENPSKPHTLLDPGATPNYSPSDSPHSSASQTCDPYLPTSAPPPSRPHALRPQDRCVQIVQNNSIIVLNLVDYLINDAHKPSSLGRFSHSAMFWESYDLDPFEVNNQTDTPRTPDRRWMPGKRWVLDRREMPCRYRARAGCRAIARYRAGAGQENFIMFHHHLQTLPPLRPDIAAAAFRPCCHLQTSLLSPDLATTSRPCRYLQGDTHLDSKIQNPP
jgi:hypothetical protein